MELSHASSPLLPHGAGRSSINTASPRSRLRPRPGCGFSCIPNRLKRPGEIHTGSRKVDWAQAGDGHDGRGPHSARSYPERLQKVLAHAGLGSRRGCETLILQGRVSVNGEVVRQLGTRVDPARAGSPSMASRSSSSRWSTTPSTSPRLRVDQLRPSGRPASSTCSPRFRNASTPSAAWTRRAPVLSLLTNDGELANRLAYPRYGVEKLYRAPGRRPAHARDAGQAHRGRLVVRRQGPRQTGADRGPPGAGHHARAGTRRRQKTRNPPDAVQARAQGHVAASHRGRARSVSKDSQSANAVRCRSTKSSCSARSRQASRCRHRDSPTPTHRADLTVIRAGHAKPDQASSGATHDRRVRPTLIRISITTDHRGSGLDMCRSKPRRQPAPDARNIPAHKPPPRFRKTDRQQASIKVENDRSRLCPNPEVTRAQAQTNLGDPMLDSQPPEPLKPRRRIIGLELDSAARTGPNRRKGEAESGLRSGSADLLGPSSG